MIDMGVNKVEVNGFTIMDLTGDTVTPNTLAQGTTAHNAAGDPITGTMVMNNDFIIKVKCTAEYLVDGESNVYWIADPYRMTDQQFQEARTSGKKIKLEIEMKIDGGTVTLTAPFSNNIDGLPGFSATYDGNEYKFVVLGKIGIEASDGSTFDGIVIQCYEPVSYVMANQVTTYLSSASTHNEYPTAKATYDAIKTEVPVKVSKLENDAGYLTETQVEAIARSEVSAVEAKIPTVPTKVSEFQNDAEYLSASQIKEQFPTLVFPILVSNGQRINCEFDQVIDALNNHLMIVAVDGYPITQGVDFEVDNDSNVVSATLTVIGNNYLRSITILNDGSCSWSEPKSLIPENNASSDVFYVPFKVGASGFELDGVTYADLQEAYDAGKRLVIRGYVPDVLGLGVAGNFELPLSYLTESGMFSFTMLCGQTAGEAFIGPDGNISVQIKTLVSFEDNVTSSISQSASDKEVPSAKAVYDAIEEAKSAGGSGGMSQTVVTSVHSGSKDSEIPTAKAVYDAVYDHTITYFNVMCDNDRWYLLDTSFDDIMYKISSSQSKFSYALVSIVSSAKLDIPGIMDDTIYCAYLVYMGYDFYCFAFTYGARRFELKIYDDNSVTITEVTN